MLQQINFPLHQQQHYDTQSRVLTEEQQKVLQQQQFEEDQTVDEAQGYIDESGNLCILQFAPETLDEPVGATSKQYSRHSTREKTRSSQKRRKKKKSKQHQAKATKELGKEKTCKQVFWAIKCDMAVNQYLKIKKKIFVLIGSFRIRLTTVIFGTITLLN